MHDLIVGNADQLRFAAAWFEALKLERRRLRIRSGNAQELYFPVCFELAVTKGAPTPQDRETTAAVLHEIHQGRDRTAIEVLNEYVARPDVVASADRSTRPQLARRAGRTTPSLDPFLAELDDRARARQTATRAAAARQRVWSAVIADTTPYNLGALARIDGGRAALVDRRAGLEFRCATTATASRR